MDKSRSALVLEIEIRLPNLPNENYRSYRVFTVPAFIGNETVELQSNVQAIGVSENGNVIAFTSCINKSQVYYCTHQLGVSTNQCYAQLFFDQSSIVQNYCPFTVVQTKITCFVKQIETGLLISTKNEMPVHQIATGPNLFAKRGKNQNNIFLLENTKIVKSLRCNGRDYRTQNSDIFSTVNITIHTNYTVGVIGHNSMNYNVKQFLTKLDSNITDQSGAHEKLLDHVVEQFTSVKNKYLILISIMAIIVVIVGIKMGQFVYKWYHLIRQRRCYRSTTHISLEDTKV